MSEAYDIHGNVANKDIHGNAQDKNVHGSRPQDAQGNPPKDIFGNVKDDHQPQD